MLIKTLPFASSISLIKWEFENIKSSHPFTVTFLLLPSFFLVSSWPFSWDKGSEAVLSSFPIVFGFMMCSHESTWRGSYGLSSPTPIPTRTVYILPILLLMNRP